MKVVSYFAIIAFSMGAYAQASPEQVCQLGQIQGEFKLAENNPRCAPGFKLLTGKAELKLVGEGVYYEPYFQNINTGPRVSDSMGGIHDRITETTCDKTTLKISDIFYSRNFADQIPKFIRKLYWSYSHQSRLDYFGDHLVIYQTKQLRGYEKETVNCNYIRAE